MNTQRALDQYERELENEIYHFAYYRCPHYLLPELHDRAVHLLQCFRALPIPLERVEASLWALEIDRQEALNR